MNSRERVNCALSHKEPDRVPVDYWATQEIESKLLKHFGFSDREEILQKFNVDFRYIEGPKYIGPELPVNDDGCLEDHWGVPRVHVDIGCEDKAGAYREVIDFPLEKAETLEEIHDYPKWPSPDHFDYECVREQTAEARSTGKVVVFVGDRMNRCAQLKPAMYIRGVEQILLDFVLNPEIAEYIFARITEFYLEYARRTFEAAGDNLDILLTGDDFGTQNGMFISPAMWRQFLRPGFKSFIDLGKQYGYKVGHHTCGSVRPIIPDMIDCGLDILNPVQPEAYDMDHGELKSLFGDRLSFHGSISIQQTLPFGTPDDVRNEVKKRMEILAPDGGFIFCTAHNFQADTPVENILTLFEAYHEFGRY